jgi:elongation factor Ts
MMAAQITSEMIKTLRERTGVGMAKCKQALEAAAGDMEKAIDILRKEGAASAVKKSARETNEGIIGAKEDASGVVLMEVNAETDFVVKNEKFSTFVDALVSEALSSKPSSVEALLSKSSKNGHTFEENRVELIQTIGENIQVKRMKVIPKRANCSYGLYRHMGGKIITLVEIAGSSHFDALAKDVAMHVAADAPEYLNAAEIPEDVIAREKEIAMSQLKNKPADMVEKILVGKIKAYADQVCLVGQKFIKDNSVSVEQHVACEGKKSGAHLVITKFLRWEVGGA